MATWKEIVQHYHVKHNNQIAKVTKPLLECFDIVCVDYLKTHTNGKFTYLSNRPECTEYYASEQLYRNDPFFRHPHNYKTGFWWLENVSGDFLDPINKINQKFSLHSPLLLIKVESDFAEMFCFSGKSDEILPGLNFQLLKTYTAYYKKELSSILHQMEEEEFSLTDLLGESFYSAYKDLAIDNQSIHAFLNKIGKQADVEKAASLSSRERDCLRLLIHGNSAKDSALELNLSHRTVEFYLENAKNKLNCNGKRELFSLASELENLGLL